MLSFRQSRLASNRLHFMYALHQHSCLLQSLCSGCYYGASVSVMDNGILAVSCEPCIPVKAKQNGLCLLGDL